VVITSLNLLARQKKHHHPTPSGTLRRDIQGLRAVAVLAVIANHLFGYPTGGFVGVDVFFVISGFIITSMLLRQHEQKGKISFVDFYRRRVKRILPASVLVLVVTVVASFVVFRAARAGTILTDGVWSLLFAANWRFATAGTDYWADDGTVSPLQHYWSLAVEEQFYFVWPLLLLGTFAIAHKLHLPATSSRKVLFLVLGALTVTSFGWALLDTADNSAWAYFSTFSRAWELGVGALLAIAAGAARMIPNMARPAMAWIGLGGIFASFFLLSSSSPIPAPGVVLPVLSTALVLAAGTGGTQKFLSPLTNRAAGYIGDISFSLYLWHFPAIVLIEALVRERSITYFALVLLTTLVLSVASYHLVENPIRKSSWLEAKPPGRPKRRITLDGLKYAGLGVLATCTAVMCALALNKTMPPDSSPVAVPAVQSVPDTAGPGEPAEPVNTLSSAIDAALVAEEWPELTPSIDNVMSEGSPVEDQAGCSEIDLSDPNACFFPNDGAIKTAVVVGDSTGITLLPTVREALGASFDVKGLTRAGCVILDVEINFDSAEDREACESHKALAAAEINALQPDVVFVSTMYNYIENRVAETPTHLAKDEWQTGTESFISSIEASGAQVVIVGAPPLGKPLTDCATNFSSPDDCEVELSTAYAVVSSAHADAAQSTGATYIDTSSWFCNADGRCPSFVEDTPIKRDAVHTTRQYASKLAPLLQEKLTPLDLGA
jgi:peptidoglycan/LPS O-acetylase OafA/YrhL